jgi:PTH1 family peptidyl-tRNA hydrolase
MIPSLVVGLGNDEKKYDYTPHNIGFQALDVLARRFKLTWKDEKNKVHAATKGDVRFIKPKSLMNISGTNVYWAAGWWRVPASALLVVCDDFSLPWGKIRIRRKGSSGGHNGLDSVIQSFNTEDIARLRIGVGPVPAGMDPKDFVLKKVDAETLGELAALGADALNAVLVEGVDAAMNHFNGLPG